MQVGCKFRIYPSSSQKVTLNKWIGCQRAIYNAKVEEHRLQSYFTYKVLDNAGLHPVVNNEYAHLKSSELTPWLLEVPSTVLSNGSYYWRQAMAGFFKGLNKKPRRQNNKNNAGVWLTGNTFRFEPVIDDSSGVVTHRFHVGTKKFPLGYINFVAHRDFKIPSSVHIVRNAHKWYVSFNFDDGQYEWTDQENIARLEQFKDEELQTCTLGVDQGVAIPFATSKLGCFDYSPAQKQTLAKCERYTRRFARQASRRKKGGSNQKKSWQRVARYQNKAESVKRDFAHQISHKLATHPEVEMIAFEKLNTTGMVRRPKPKQDAQGRWIKNGARAKSGLNKAILGSVWGSVKEKTVYKARRLGKPVLEVKAHHSSQECAQCGAIHAGNRTSQSLFLCLSCGHEDNADMNASRVIAKRAIALLREGVVLPKKKTKRIRRNKVGAECTEPMGLITPSTPTETASDAETVYAVSTQLSKTWEARLFRAE